MKMVDLILSEKSFDGCTVNVRNTIGTVFQVITKRYSIKCQLMPKNILLNSANANTN